MQMKTNAYTKPSILGYLLAKVFHSLQFAILFLSLVTLLSSCAKEASFNMRTHSKSDPKKIEKNWKFKWGDSPKSSDGTFEWAQSQNTTDGSWISTNSPGTLPERNGNNTVWITTILPEFDSREKSLWLAGVDQAMDIFVDGKMIYSFGDIDSNGIGKFQGYPWHIADLPANASGRPITFRVWSGHMNIGLIGDTLVASRDAIVENIFLGSINNFAMGIILAFMGLVSLIVFAAHRKDKAFFYFGVHTLIGIYTISRMMMKFYIIQNSYTWTIIELVTLTLGATGIIGFIEFVLGPTRWRHCHHMARFGLALSGAILIAGITRKVPFLTMLIPAQAYSLLCIILSIFTFIPAVKKKVLGTRLLLGGVVILAFSAFFEIAIETRLFWPQYAGKLFFLPWGTFALITSMGGTLLLRYAAVHRKILRLKSQLERILVGTKEMATIYEKFGVVRKAIQCITSEIPFGKEVTIDVILFASDGAIKPISYRIFEKQGISETPSLIGITEQEVNSINLLLANANTAIVANTAIIQIVWGENKIGALRIAGFSTTEFQNEEMSYAETMANSLAMAISNINMLIKTEQKAKLDAELEAARAIQEALLPQKGVLPGIEIAHSYQSADSTGGDWLGYFYDRNNHRLNCYVGDVTGHGIAASLLTGVMCGGVYSTEESMSLHEMNSKTFSTPEERLTAIAHILNRIVRQTGKTNVLATMAFLSLDLETGKVAFLNAGHTSPIIIRSTERSLQSISNLGNRLGFNAVPSFSVRSFNIKPGETIFLYTDGLTENSSPAGATFSQRRLREILTSNSCINDISNRITEESKRLWLGCCQDDVTTLLIQWQRPVTRKEVALAQIIMPGCDALSIEKLEKQT